MINEVGFRHNSSYVRCHLKYPEAILYLLPLRVVLRTQPEWL